MNGDIVVTMCDSGYYPLITDLIQSIRASRFLDDIEIGVIDCGLLDDQRDALQKQHIRIAEARWNFDWQPEKGIRRKFLAMLSRPFIPSYFPEHNCIVYLDADTWVQDRLAIIDLIKVAENADIAIVPELHPSYQFLYHDAHIIRRVHRSSYIDCFGKHHGDPGFSAVLNSGVFAARSNSKVWAAWQAKLSRAMQESIVLDRSPEVLDEKAYAFHFIEQNALNAVFKNNEITIGPLSALYNWVCTLAMPKFDLKTGMLVEPIPPYAPLRVIHLTGDGKRATSIMDLNGIRHSRQLTYTQWRASHQV